MLTNVHHEGFFNNFLLTLGFSHDKTNYAIIFKTRMTCMLNSFRNNNGSVYALNTVDEKTINYCTQYVFIIDTTSRMTSSELTSERHVLPFLLRLFGDHSLFKILVELIVLFRANTILWTSGIWWLHM